MRERLQKILSARGVASRRKAEQMIQNGAVSVNGVTAALGDSADPELDRICVNGQPLPTGQRFVYILLNKPRGYVTTLSDEKGRPNAAQLVADCGTRVYPVGRLDKDTEGLLLITNDGQLAHALLAPRRHVDKVYEVTLRDPVTEEAIKKLEAGIRLNDEEVCAPAKVDVLAPNRVHLTIHEGKYHQVKRMFAMCDNEVVYLKRIQIKNLVLDPNLEAGGYRALSEEEETDLKTVLEGKKEG